MNSKLFKNPIKSNIDNSIWPWSYDNTNFPILDRYPKISIVIPTFNQGDFIEETLRSIIFQRYPNLELIIIDACSTDSTKEIINYYINWVDIFVSEPDSGQSDAINKGWNLATGEITNWINSDDYLAPNTLHKIAKIYNEENSNVLIVGNVLNFESDNRNNKYLSVQDNINLESILNFWTTKSSWHQPGIFFPMDIIKYYGELDVNYHYSMDFDLLCKVLTQCKVVYCNDIFIYFRIHSKSKGVTYPDKTINEKFNIVSKYIKTRPTLFFYISILFWTMKVLISTKLKLKSKINIFKSTFYFVKSTNK